MNIQYLFHDGDIIDDEPNQKEWVQADEAYQKLDDAEFPYGILAGNHDVGHLNGDSVSYTHLDVYKRQVDLSRAFLDTNGAHQETDVFVEIPGKEDNALTKTKEVKDVKEAWLSTLADLNTCSQKGLVEMFDGSIGAGSVFMPYGGKYQLTETQTMVAKVPVLNGKTETVTMMSYGFDPYVLSLIHI